MPLCTQLQELCGFSKLGIRSVSICALIHLLPVLVVLETGPAGTHQ